MNIKQMIIPNNFPKAIIAFFVITILIQSCKIEYFTGKWAVLTINQDSTDNIIFASPLRFYDTNTRLQYSVFNDNKNLYFYIKATEKMVQEKVLQSGILLKLDTTGKQKFRTEILYPIPNKNQNKIPINSPDDWDLFVSRYSYDHSYMNVNGFKNIYEEEIPIINSSFGISVTISWDTIGVMRYKATIPFAQFFKDSITSKDTSSIIGFSVILKALEDPNISKQQTGSTTAMSNAEENAMKRQKAISNIDQNKNQNERALYLYNNRTLITNYKPAIKSN